MLGGIRTLWVVPEAGLQNVRTAGDPRHVRGHKRGRALNCEPILRNLRWSFGSEASPSANISPAAIPWRGPSIT
jgi:hypothetical protein